MSDERRRMQEAVATAARRIGATGLVSGASGNVSARIDANLFAITARGSVCAEVDANAVVLIDAQAEPVDGDGIPSSETLVHLAIYAARPDAGAVIHTHSVWATALAVAGIEIPALVDEQVIALGGPVRVADYGPPMSEDLAANAVAALGDRRAVLLRNHGVLGTGAGLDEAVAVVDMVERLAQIYTLARLLGNAMPLPESVVEIEAQLYRMSSLGKKG